MKDERLLLILTITLASSLIFVKILEFGKENYGNADQGLHQRINTAPIDSLILRSPHFNATKKYGIVLLVISAAWEVDEREEIRRQWASKKESDMQKNGDSLVIFLVARAFSKQEAEKYRDLLQVGIKETYRNLVYKIAAGFRWVNENVRSDFVAKIDSDTVVHIDRLYVQLRRFNSALSGSWFACDNFYDSPVIRDKSWPWYVSESDFAPHTYPPYCSGPGYAMNRRTFENIVRNMGKHKVFEVEDAFFTGVVAQKLDEIDVVGFLPLIASSSYTNFSFCGSRGPLLSILNLDFQYDNRRWNRNITSAWERLKTPYCR